MYILKKLISSIIDIPKTFSLTPHPRLVMTLLVKNEEQMLERNLIFHKQMGVDAFIVTDNNSTDSTPQIIDEYRKRGWIIDVINETATNYEQKEWVDRMIWRAKTEFKADWIINADADEFWYSPTGNLKSELKITHANVLNVEMRSIYPEEGKPFWEWSQTVRPITDFQKYNLSQYSIFEKQNPKVIHRTSGYLQISMGNHKVKMFPQWTADSNIFVYHYNIREKAHFLQKMINGGRQLEQHKGKHGGRHWRYFYKLYKEGRLDVEYDRVIGTHCFEQLKSKGYIKTDRTITDFFQSCAHLF